MIKTIFSLILGLLLAIASLRAAPGEAEPGRVIRDLSYGPHGERNQLDLFLPAASEQPFPLIVWIHGGGWTNGNKDSGGPARRLVARGYAVASINYRYSTQAIFPAQIQDCQRAIRWLRAHGPDYHLATERIGVWGSSAGGHLVALLGTAPQAFPAEPDDPHRTLSAIVQAVCAYFPVTDLTTIKTAPSGTATITRLLGGPVETRCDAALSASPLHHVSATAAPFLIVHGTDDHTVPFSQSESLHAALLAAGVASSLHLLPGADHGGDTFRQLAPEKAIDLFFDQHLRPASPAALNP